MDDDRIIARIAAVLERSPVLRSPRRLIEVLHRSGITVEITPRGLMATGADDGLDRGPLFAVLDRHFAVPVNVVRVRAALALARLEAANRLPA